MAYNDKIDDLLEVAYTCTESYETISWMWNVSQKNFKMISTSIFG